jgi:branched-chain amino acid transport system ATP-binding protein
MTALLELVDVRAGYGPVEVLHGVTLGFPPGSVVALLGRNGAGKSTLLRVLAGTLALRSGVVRWRGRDITRMPAYARAADGLALVPDEHSVFTDLSVRENLELFASGGEVDPALEVFPELGARLDQRAGTLSGGERQMVALSRVMLRPAGAILLDEVSRGLSPGVVVRLSDAIAGLAGSDRVVVIVEQYLQDVLRLADTVYVLRRGEVAFAGEPSELSGSALDDSVQGA